MVEAPIWVVPSFPLHVTDCEGSLFVASMPAFDILQATSAFVCTLRIRTSYLGLHNIAYAPELRIITTPELTVQPNPSHWQTNEQFFKECMMDLFVT
jgi:hypothetical protein